MADILGRGGVHAGKAFMNTAYGVANTAFSSSASVEWAHSVCQVLRWTLGLRRDRAVPPSSWSAAFDGEDQWEVWLTEAHIPLNKGGAAKCEG